MIGAASRLTASTGRHFSFLKNLSLRITPTVTSISVRGVIPNISTIPFSRAALMRSYASSSSGSNKLKSLPSHEVVGLPSVSPTMSSGKIVKWLKKEGDRVSPGDALFEIETDKAVMSYEVTDKAVLAKILVAEGSESIPLGHPIAVMVTNEKDVKSFETLNVNDFLEEVAQPEEPTKTQEKPQQVETKKEEKKPVSAGKPKKVFPSHEVVGVPSVSPTMTSGKIVKWLKAEGDKLIPGDALFEIETDKAVMSYEVTDKGILGKILVQEGSDSIPLGYPIAVIVSSDKDISAFKDAKVEDFLEGAQGSEEIQTTEQIEEVKETTGTAQKTSQGDRVFVSPLAKKISKEQDVDYSKLEGTGPKGRIVAEDVLNAAQKKLEAPVSKAKPEVAKPIPIPTPTPIPTPIPTPTAGLVSRPGYKDIEHSSIRRVIAQRLSESKHTIPHYYLTVDLQVDKLLELRAKLNTYSTVKISVNDMLIKAAAKACQEEPMVNASWQDNFIRVFDYVDISVAVQTDKGLLTPIVKDAHTKTISDISKNVKELAEKAKASKLKPEEFQGGTFTISNLGMFGIKQFTAVINPPQAAILAVGTSEKKVVIDAEGNQSISSQMTVTLSCDHRVIDGAIGAKWLLKFKKYIEDPFTMLV